HRNPGSPLPAFPPARAGARSPCPDRTPDGGAPPARTRKGGRGSRRAPRWFSCCFLLRGEILGGRGSGLAELALDPAFGLVDERVDRSEEHTSELQSR